MVEIDDFEEIMEISEYQNIFENEEKHFYYVTIHSLVLGLIGKYVRVGPRKILDAGCGTGGLLKKLCAFGEASGVDISPEAIKYSRKRGLVLKCAGVTNLPFPEESFDVVTSIDVIYHKAVGDDVEALKEMRRVLKEEGVLILRVPANKYLLSAHDREVHTARRYSKKDIGDKMTKAGFHIKQISYVGMVLFPLSLVKILLERIFGNASSSSIDSLPSWINWCFTQVLMLENRLILSGISLPFGQGLIVVAQR